MNHNLKLRVITGLSGLPVILYLILGMGIEGVALFAGIISTGMLYEYSQMFFSLEDKFAKTTLLLFSNVAIHFFNFWFAVGFGATFLGMAPFFVFFIFFLLSVPRLLRYRGVEALNSSEGEGLLHRHVEELKSAVFGWIYCGWIPLLMVTIRSIPDGKFWLMLMLMIVWASDTFAYFFGKAFGKRKLFDSVSPKKTWEGFLGGTLGAVMVAIVFSHYFLKEIEPVKIGCIAFLLSVVATLGDLGESLLKRAAKVKDSSGILPGHGGFLDRFDGVLFAIPVIYLLLMAII